MFSLHICISHLMFSLHICISHLRYADDTTQMAKSEKDLKSLLRKVKKLACNSTLKKLRLWHPVPSLHGKDGETMETVTDFIFLGSKITVDGDHSHEIKRHWFLGRKAMTNLDSILKIRDITLLTETLYSQSYGFSSSHVQI